MKILDIINEEWSQKYKNSINCSHPKGFGQKAHCAGKKKHTESMMTMEAVCPDCGMCQTHGNVMEIKKGAKDSNGFTKCWPGKHAEGTKKGKNGGQVRNCVPNESQGVAESRENFNGIDISMKIQKDDEYVDDEDYDNQVLYVTASSKGKELGHVLFAFDGEYLMPQDLEVEERYRGQGIAQTMYDYVKSKGYKIRRSGQQTDAGAGFWDKHKGPGQNVWEHGVVKNFADGKHPGRKELDPDVYEDLDNSIIARIARQIVPTIRAKQTPEGYVYLKTADGLSLVIGCNIADGSIDINIGSQPMETTSSGPHKGAITEIIQAVYAAAVKQYGTPSQPGTLNVDHDAGHGVWQHIAQKLGLQYDSHMVKENFAMNSNKTLKSVHPGSPVTHGIRLGQQGVAEDIDLEERFNIIESMIEYWAEHHGVDSDVIWEDLEEVDDEDLLSEAEAWQTSRGKNKNGGLNKKGVSSYRSSHPGSHLQTAVTTKPSKLKPGSKAAKRRKSFCARMKGMKKHRTGSKTARDPNSRINKSLRKWNCH